MSVAGQLGPGLILCHGMTEPSAFELFLGDYQDMVYSTAFRLLGREAEAQDVAQEVFLRAWNHFESLQDRVSAGGWLKTVTRNLCLNHLERYRSRWQFFSDLRSEGSDSEELGPDAFFAAPESHSEELLTADQRDVLDRALAALPESQRVALVLYHFEDMDYAEIADRLRVSLGKVKTDIHRARQALFKKLQPYREELGV